MRLNKHWEINSQPDQGNFWGLCEGRDIRERDRDNAHMKRRKTTRCHSQQPKAAKGIARTNSHSHPHTKFQTHAPQMRVRIACDTDLCKLHDTRRNNRRPQSSHHALPCFSTVRAHIRAAASGLASIRSTFCLRPSAEW
jgi:hypothetical protein